MNRRIDTGFKYTDCDLCGGLGLIETQLDTTMDYCPSCTLDDLNESHAENDAENSVLSDEDCNNG